MRIENMRLKKYMPIYKIGFFTMMTYRWECLVAAMSSILVIAFMYYLWNAIFLGVGNSSVINLVGFQSTFVYVAIGVTILVTFNSSADLQVSNAIISGDMVRELIRPLNYHMKLFVGSFGSIGFRIFLVFIPCFCLVYFLVPAGYFNLYQIGLFLLSLPCALLILFHIDVLTGLLSVRTEASWGVRLAKDYLVMFFSGAIIPFHFLPPDVKHIFMWLPFQGICHTPLYILTHQSMDTFELLRLFAVQIFWTILLVLIVKMAIRRMIYKIEIYGG